MFYNISYQVSNMLVKFQWPFIGFENVLLKKKVIGTSRARPKICVKKKKKVLAMVNCMHSSIVTGDGSALITLKQYVMKHTTSIVTC